MSVAKTPQGRWRAQVKFRGVKVADRTFVRKTDAVRWHAEQVRRLQDGDFVSPAAGRVTVAELAGEYLESRRQHVSVRGWESDESALRVHILPAWGPLPVGSLTSVQVSRLLGDLAVARSVGTAARVRTTVRGLLTYAVQTRRLSVSPADGVALPRPDVERAVSVAVNPFTREQLLSVVAAQRRISEGRGARVSPHASRYADVTLVLGLTGLRMGELRALRVRDVVGVPYPAFLVQRSHPQSARSGRVIERDRTKGGRSRLVPLVKEVQQVVAGWVAGRDPEALLFPSPEGAFLRAGNWRRSVHWDRTGLGRRPHDLRHTAATLWLGAGVDVKTVSAWLGHASTKLTLDTYGHWMGTDADRAAIARLEAAFGTDAAMLTGPSRDRAAGQGQERRGALGRDGGSDLR